MKNKKPKRSNQSKAMPSQVGTTKMARPALVRNRSESIANVRQTGGETAVMPDVLLKLPLENLRMYGERKE